MFSQLKMNRQSQTQIVNNTMNIKEKVIIIKVLTEYIQDKALIPQFLAKIKTVDELYECVGLFERYRSVAPVLAHILNEELMWNDQSLQPFLEIEREEDQFLETPPDVAEGVIQCNKCGCTKVYKMTKQTRSADEPVSLFAFCIKCRRKWVM